jgi:hypothetical protein
MSILQFVNAQQATLVMHSVDAFHNPNKTQEEIHVILLHVVWAYHAPFIVMTL